ncbi:hypothetical protein [Pseudomonas sp. efr-133-TYG-103a]|jgi:hypothetical protein|uniref:hypothetical protein n=1 Tax=Pseudomonas sp. efr-133-TYG-103a TaxID=3040308 RepID=UPI002552B4C2|nr:hypothetical protein [Pseudomonas sp. efr-133-TYG-103a]
MKRPCCFFISVRRKRFAHSKARATTMPEDDFKNLRDQACVVPPGGHKKTLPKQGFPDHASISD